MREALSRRRTGRPAPATGRRHRRLEVPLRMGRSLVAVLVQGAGAAAARFGARLRADGYRVATAEDLEAGLELSARVRPDLIFVDLGGWAVPALVLLALRTTPATANLPTVLISERNPEELAAEVGGLRPNEQVLHRQR